MLEASFYNPAQIFNCKKFISRPSQRVREGWAEAFRAMAARGDDQLLDRENLIGQSSWDAKEWEM